jgi:hypothetical protein
VTHAWKQVIAETLEDAAARLENRSRFLRSAGMKEEANEANLCAKTVREMIKETT